MEMFHLSAEVSCGHGMHPPAIVRKKQLLQIKKR